jgi:E3 ubiquitin-protein ligase RNF1/2
MTTSEKSELTEDSESASEVDGQTEGGDSNADTEDGTEGSDEIELVFKPHPVEMGSDNVVIKALKENTVRYLKTTSNASVDHLSKYLAMRLSLDAQMADQTLPTLVYTIYIAPMPGQYVVLNGNQTLQQVNEKFWKVKLKILLSIKKLYN